MSELSPVLIGIVSSGTAPKLLVRMPASQGLEAGDIGSSGIAALIAGGADMAALASFVGAATYTSTAALITGNAEMVGAGTFSPPGTFTATAALTAGNAEMAAAGSVTAPVYTGTAALTTGNAEVAASGTATAPSFTATAAITTGNAEMAASATFTGAAPLLQDTFTDTNGTNLTSHTMDVGGGWTSHNGGAWEIQSNRGRTTSSVLSNYISADAGDADVEVTCTVNFGSSSEHVGLCARVTNGSNGWEIYGRVNDDDVVIVENNAGVRTVRASGAQTFAASTDYAMKVTCNGNTITAYINDVQICQYASATHNNTATRFGLMVHNAGGSDEARWDDFEVVAV